jgi:hypothetical protein
VKANAKRLKDLARDLRKEEPRHVSETLAGFEGAARCLDKCRALLLGWQGEYHYGCGMDQMFLTEAGISKEEFQEMVASGASDEEVEQWLSERAGVRR